MYHEDYLMRMIKALAAMVHKLINAGRKASSEEIDQMLEETSGLSSELFKNSSQGSLLQLLKLSCQGDDNQKAAFCILLQMRDAEKHKNVITALGTSLNKARLDPELAKYFETITAAL